MWGRVSSRSSCEPALSRGWLAALGGAVLLAGCGEGNVTTQSYAYRQDVPGHEQYAAAIGPTPVAVYNSPYPADDVIAAMQGRTPGPKMTFTGNPDGSATYRVVLVFGESHAAPSTYCQVQAVTAGPSPTGRLTVTAAFCAGTSILSDAVARTDAIASPHDPEFERMMTDLLSALMPRNNPLSVPDMGSGTM